MILLLVISFFLDGYISTLINNNSLFNPIFSVVFIVLAYSSFNDKKKLLGCCLLLGLLYDMTFTQTLFLNVGIFIILGYVAILFNRYIPDNFFNKFILLNILIILYRTLTYIFLVLTLKLQFEFNILFQSIYRSIIINYIYFIIVTFILFIIEKKGKKYKNVHLFVKTIDKKKCL